MISSPWDLALLPDKQNLAIAMAGPHQIWQLNLSTGEVHRWAGSGRENIIDGSLVSAAFAQPSGLAIDDRHLFIADSEVSGIRQIQLKNANKVETIVGQGLFEFGDKDGKGANVRLQHCLGLAFGDQKLFVADTYNNKIKICNPETKQVHAFVGSVKPGSTDEPAAFDEPGGLSVAGEKLYVADTNNHLVRVVDIKSKKVSTLKLTGLSAPKFKQVPAFPNPIVVKADAVEVAPGKAFKITVEPKLDKGYELNEEAQVTYLVETPEKPLSLSNENPTTGGKIEPKQPITVNVPLAEASKGGDTMEVKVSVRAMVCLPNALCTVKSYVWNVPVKFKDGASNAVTIKAK
jgi:hypothetical protein